MIPVPNQTLRNITSFTELVEYLCDELDWPIDVDDFKSYTFEWDAVEDLGVAPEHAAKIQDIKQLRPLTDQQPWGIFFIDFEPKKLPVGVLRRLLNKLVTKKRASANSNDQQTWDQDDLLFISSFGKDDHSRELAFAHFHQEDGDLPTLRVLGWDGSDTPLKLDHVNKELQKCLRWPEDEADLDTWRNQWSKAFKHRIGHTIQTADMLAKVLAELAKNIRDRCQTLMLAEPDDGPLKKLFKAFQTALIHDLTEETFADTYAQTITYGLLTAAISRTDRISGGGTYVNADNVTDMVPVTNPFLKEMLQSFLQAGGRAGGLNFDELGVQDVVELLRDEEQTDLAAVLRDFGNRNPDEDPVIHFYEHFLAVYDKDEKKKRGVFYTPLPVVSYIVRSVHELLQTEFDLEDGLASTITWGEMIKKNPEIKLPPKTDDSWEKQTISPDEYFVQILDPATGTGTFIVEVIDVIHKHLKEKWDKGGANAMPKVSGRDFPVSTFQGWWNGYVPAALLPRLYAYELLMAPYAIAHMKIGLKLHETGYRFGSDERVRVYLTNALEPWQRQLTLPDIEVLAHEAEAVNTVKREKRFNVVVGNPPYSLVSANMKPEQRFLVERFKFIGTKRIRERGALQLEKILNDDYVKFIAKSRDDLSVTGVGLLGVITNHAYLDNPTMRGLRYSLMESFKQGFFYNIGGSAKKAEKETDENVFDIQQGVCIGILILNGKNLPTSHQHAFLPGSREMKYKVLGTSSVVQTNWNELSPTPPFYLFVPTDYDLRDEYEQYAVLNDVFALKSIGLFTSKDSLVLDWSADAVEKKVRVFQKSTLTNKELCDHVGITAKAAWNVTKSRERLAGISNLKSHIVRFLHRPFDYKYLFYERSLVWSMAWPVNHNLLSRGNLALTVSRQLASPPWNHVFCSNTIVELCYITNKTKEGNHVFPLYVLPDDTEAQMSFAGHDSRRLNFNTAFLEKFSSMLGLKFKRHDVFFSGLTPEDIFRYIYAVFHSPGYRSRYAEFLKIDFPRLPLTTSLNLFRSLAKLGEQLVALHLMESPTLDNHITKFIGETQQVSKVTYTDDNGGTVWIDGSGTKKAPSAGTSGFCGVPEAVWNFHIGGYQVCEKWLKDRAPKKGKPGHTLTDEDINHYHKIVVALSETIRVMAEIDEVIEEHGGWPGAFVTADKEDADE